MGFSFRSNSEKRDNEKRPHTRRRAGMRGVKRGSTLMFRSPASTGSGLNATTRGGISSPVGSGAHFRPAHSDPRFQPGTGTLFHAAVVLLFPFIASSLDNASILPQAGRRVKSGGGRKTATASSKRRESAPAGLRFHLPPQRRGQVAASTAMRRTCRNYQRIEKSRRLRLLLFVLFRRRDGQPSVRSSRNTSAFFRKYSTPEYTVVATMTT